MNRKEKEKRRKGKEKRNRKRKKQGRIHGNPVADGWAGAVMRKPLVIQKCYLRTDRHSKFLSRVFATKKFNKPS